MIENELIESAKDKGLVIKKEKTGHSIYFNNKQIKFFFDIEKLNLFVQDFDKEGYEQQLSKENNIKDETISRKTQNKKIINVAEKKISNMSKKNKIVRISLMGGLIGALTTNPRNALESAINKANGEGWNAIHIESHRTTNLFIFFLQLIVLAITLGLFTWGGGFLVLLEKEV